MRSAIESDALDLGRTIAANDGDQLAVCLIDPLTDGGLGSLRRQQQLTSMLRARLRERAEAIAVFVVTGVVGDDVDAIAIAWEASEVIGAAPAEDGKTEPGWLRNCQSEDCGSS